MLFTSLRALIFFTFVLGTLYPLLMTGLSGWIFPREAAGSLVSVDGVLVASRWIAQKTEDPRFFWFRPSASDYATVASGASNLSPASLAFIEAVAKRRADWGAAVPADLLTTSGSGLDPHISIDSAKFQTSRVCDARKLDEAKRKIVSDLVSSATEGPTFGFLGQTRVNVVKLNADLFKLFGK